MDSLTLQGMGREGGISGSKLEIEGDGVHRNSSRHRFGCPGKEQRVSSQKNGLARASRAYIGCGEPQRVRRVSGMERG